MGDNSSIKFFFLTYVAETFYYKSVDLPEDDSFDKLFNEVAEEFYSKVPPEMRELQIFSNYKGLNKFNEWLGEKFGKVPVGLQWPDFTAKSGCTYKIQPFGKIHAIEV